MKNLYNKIALLGEKYKANKIILYGSRARGDNHNRSDIDIAVFGMPTENQPVFLDSIDKLPTLLKFDVAFITEKTNTAFLSNIERDGILLMYKYENFIKAIARLQESIEEYNNNPTTTVRDGVIQRFEFCAELAWKSTREYLQSEGYENINSPKSTMRTAYADGIIDDEKGWLSLIESRNSTSHIYDEQMANDVYKEICCNYLPLFVDLAEKLK